HFGFPVPEIMARLSVWAQFSVGLAFITGLLTRWAGLLCTVNFIVALVMVDAAGGIRASFPSACLIAVGIYLALHGAGRFSLDHVLESKAKQKNCHEGEEKKIKIFPTQISFLCNLRFILLFCLSASLHQRAWKYKCREGR